MTATAKPAARLTLTISDAIAWIIIENEARLNAFTLAMWEELPRLVRAADGDERVRAIVLRGAGVKAFSAGADISEFDGNRTGADAAHYDRVNDLAFSTMAGATKPTVAMIHGYCFGGGCELAICCDLRWAANDALFSVPSAKLSVGYNPRWVRPMLSAISPAKTKEMLFTGRRYPATDALQMGLVNAVVPQGVLETEVRLVVGEIATNAPLSIRAAKRSVDEMVARPESADMASLDALVQACFDSEDFKEGTRAFLEKRKPVFRGR